VIDCEGSWGGTRESAADSKSIAEKLAISMKNMPTIRYNFIVL